MEIKIEKETVEEVVYSIYGEDFLTKEEAAKYKRQVDTEMNSNYYLVHSESDPKGIFTEKEVFKVDSNLGESLVIEHLYKRGVPFLTYYSIGRLVPITLKNVKIEKVDIGNWNEYFRFLENTKELKVTTLDKRGEKVG